MTRSAVFGRFLSVVIVSPYSRWAPVSTHDRPCSLSVRRGASTRWAPSLGSRWAPERPASTSTPTLRPRASRIELGPEALEQEGLVGALAKQAAALRARHGISVDEVFDAEPEVPIAVKEALFRIAQEALNNTAKHVRASHVELRLTSAGEAYVIEIRDDGAG